MPPSDYQLLDSGNRQKLERFGTKVLLRPAPQAVWLPQLESKAWERAEASFSREENQGWVYKKALEKSWAVALQGLLFTLELSNFGHVGLFPEHAAIWKILQDYVRTKGPCKVLNLFAYSGGATLAAAAKGASVTHLDASKKSVQLAKENARLNNLDKKPIRWIVDDVKKFLLKEIRRGATYDAIVMDPPSFGRGTSGEVFKIENDLGFLIESAQKLLSKNKPLLLFSTHTPGFTPRVLHQLFTSYFSEGVIEAHELFLGEGDYIIPSGSYVLWHG